MHWADGISENDRFFLESRRKPEWVNRATPNNWFMWQAYHHLRASRNERGAIPFSEISAYCDWAGLTCHVQRTRLANIVIALDNSERVNAPSA